ncbi:hypothetical protein YB2330_003269 [Saitoella coloradoensis]
MQQSSPKTLADLTNVPPQKRLKLATVMNVLPNPRDFIPPPISQVVRDDFLPVYHEEFLQETYDPIDNEADPDLIHDLEFGDYNREGEDLVASDGEVFPEGPTMTQEQRWVGSDTLAMPPPPLPSSRPAFTPLNRSDPLSISHPRYGLQSALVQAYVRKGIRTLYDWQARCLDLPGLLEGSRNVVYTAPTSGGKTMVSEILMLKRVFETKSKAILVLPFVSIVTEKTRHLRSLLEGTDKVVAGYFGGEKQKAWNAVDIAVCTIEKANSLINTALSEGKLDELGVLVVDELHMLGEDRGYIIELMLTKLLAINQDVQIVGMSATLKNLPLLANWLRAHAFSCDFRPVPLHEYIVRDNTVFDTAAKPVCIIPQAEHKALKDTSVNALVALTLETLSEGGSVLVFCSARGTCVETAKLLFAFVPVAQADIIEKRIELIRQLRDTPSGVDEILEGCVMKGIAYHHAGLTTEERELLESAYSDGVLKILCATATLAAGINLPARRVIFRSPRMGRDFLSLASYRQMKGRAGRAGKDPFGESFLCCAKMDTAKVNELVHAPLPSVESCLKPEKRGLKRALLEVIATNLASTESAVMTYAQSTLLYSTEPGETGMKKLVDESLDYLLENKLIVKEDPDGYTAVEKSYVATDVGLAVVASAMTPEDGLFVHAELSRGMRTIVLDDDLHLIYHVTPVYAQCEVDWRILRNAIEGLSESGNRIMSSVGVSPALVHKMAMGATLKEDKPENVEKLRIHKRFYAALMLQDLINERSLSDVAAKFDIERGFLQSLTSLSGGFASMVGAFCTKLGWGTLAMLLEHFRDRLMFGVKDDLLELAKLPYVKSATARMLAQNGLKNIHLVAAASPEDIVKLLKEMRAGRDRRSSEQLRLMQDDFDRKKADIIIDAAQRARDIMLREY